MNLSSNNQNLLIALLQRIIEMIQLPGTDTAWSGWTDVEEAIDYFIKAIERLKTNDNTIVRELEIIFAPTGSLQDLAISSGWGDAYLVLASEFDCLTETN